MTLVSPIKGVRTEDPDLEVFQPSQRTNETLLTLLQNILGVSATGSALLVGLHYHQSGIKATASIGLQLIVAPLARRLHGRFCYAPKTCLHFQGDTSATAFIKPNLLHQQHLSAQNDRDIRPLWGRSHM
jgi:hypothetical protein